MGRIVRGRDDIVTQVPRTMHKNLLVSKFRWIAENRAGAENFQRLRR